MSMIAETVYQTLFGIGAVGLLAQTVMGFAHSHGDGDGGDAGHAGADHGGAHGHFDHIGHDGHAGGMDHGGHSALGHHLAHGSAVDHDGAHGEHGDGAHDHDASNGRLTPSWHTIMGILSPMTLFSVSLGAGATGLLLGEVLRAPVLLALAAAAGGILLYSAIVRPIYRVIFGFASRPARALEGSVTKTAEAMTRFDSRGQGIIKVNVDGQIVRLLAHLDPEDAKRGVSVAPGETVVVTSVDSAKNVCQVTRL